MAGMDMMLSSLIKLAGISPEDLKARAEGVEQAVLQIAHSLRANERKLNLILKHMGIDDDQDSHGRSGNGPDEQGQLEFTGSGDGTGGDGGNAAAHAGR